MTSKKRAIIAAYLHQQRLQDPPPKSAPLRPRPRQGIQRSCRHSDPRVTMHDHQHSCRMVDNPAAEGIAVPAP